jgi:hypothetical protein
MAAPMKKATDNRKAGTPESGRFSAEFVASPRTLDDDRGNAFRSLLTLLARAEDCGLDPNDAVGVAITTVADAMQHVVPAGGDRMLAEHLVSALELVRAERGLRVGAMAGHA